MELFHQHNIVSNEGSSNNMFLLLTGHKMNLSSIISVLNEVKNIKQVSVHMNMPEEQLRELFDGPDTDIVGKTASFWQETGRSWRLLKDLLMKCDEMESAHRAELMEHYNHEGDKLFY